MSLVIPPGFAQCAFRFSLSGDPDVMVTTIGVDVSSAGGDFQLLAGNIAENWITAFGAAGYPASYTFLGTVLRVGQDGAPPIIAEAPRNVVGTAAVSPMPSNCAILVRKTSNLGGRAGRGRMYLPPAWVAEVDVDANGMLNPTTRNNLQGAMNGLFATNDWVILHDNVGPVIAPTPITGLVVQPQIATQRRRMRR